MIGVGWPPPCRTRSRHAGWSSSTLVLATRWERSIGPDYEPSAAQSDFRNQFACSVLSATRRRLCGANDVVGYGIDATTGALTALAGFPVAAEADAYSVSVDPTNQFLYVTDDGAANVSGFTLDASTGALTPMSGSPFPAGHHPKFIATLFPALY